MLLKLKKFINNYFVVRATITSVGALHYFVIIYILAISVLPIFLNRPHVGMRIPRQDVCLFC